VSSTKPLKTLADVITGRTRRGRALHQPGVRRVEYVLPRPCRTKSNQDARWSAARCCDRANSNAGAAAAVRRRVMRCLVDRHWQTSLALTKAGVQWPHRSLPSPPGYTEHLRNGLLPVVVCHSRAPRGKRTPCWHGCEECPARSQRLTSQRLAKRRHVRGGTLETCRARRTRAAAN